MAESSHVEFDVQLRRFTTLLQAGRLVEALSAAERVHELAQFQFGPLHPDTTASLANLAMMHLRLGRFDSAEKMLLQALNVGADTLGTDRQGHAAILSNLGLLNTTRGNHDAALPCYEQAVDILARTQGQSLDWAKAVTGLACVHAGLGDYARAEPMLRQALSVLEKLQGQDHPDCTPPLNNLAFIYLSLGDTARADELLRRAVDTTRRALGDDHPDQLEPLNQLAQIRLGAEDVEAAEPLVREVLRVTRLVFGAEHPQHAVALHNLAAWHQLRGEIAEALPLYQRALEIDRRALGDQHADLAIRLNNLSLCHFECGDSARALALSREALALHQAALGDDPLCARRLQLLATLLAATGQYAEALSSMQQAALIDDRTLDRICAITSEQQRLTYLEYIRGNTDSTLSLVLGHFADQPGAVRAAFDLVLRRKAVAFEALALQRDAIVQSKHPELAQRLRDLSALRMRIARTAFAVPDATGQRAHDAQLAQWEQDRELLEQELAGQVPVLQLQRRLAAVDHQVVARALPAGTALVEFYRYRPDDFAKRSWGAPRYLAFVVVAAQPDGARLVDLGAAEELDRLIDQFRDEVGKPGDNRNMVRRKPQDVPRREPQAGPQLFHALMSPLLGFLADCQELWLAPDGHLTCLPFGLLPDVRSLESASQLILLAGGPLLLDRFTITYLGCGRDVLRGAAPLRFQSSAPLILADPDFDLGRQQPARSERAAGRRSRDLAESGLTFRRLPATREEGRLVARLLGQQPWQGRQALEGRLKKQCHAPRLLHIATHGFFLDDEQVEATAPGLALESRLGDCIRENPLLRSGLALAGANIGLQGGALPDEAEDGLLTAEDVSGLDLLGTELVVLSACETGLGVVRNGEGVFGLQRAFTLAGARTLIMSLWNVPDEQTRLLMTDFYARILAGAPRSRALRAAQLELRKRYPDPFYWGAFICQGDPGPLGGGSTAGAARGQTATQRVPEEPVPTRKAPRPSPAKPGQVEAASRPALPPAPPSERTAVMPRCARCDVPVEAGFRFCPNCGSSQAPKASVPAAPAATPPDSASPRQWQFSLGTTLLHFLRISLERLCAKLRRRLTDYDLAVTPLAQGVMCIQISGRGCAHELRACLHKDQVEVRLHVEPITSWGFVIGWGFGGLLIGALLAVLLSGVQFLLDLALMHGYWDFHVDLLQAVTGTSGTWENLLHAAGVLVCGALWLFTMLGIVVVSSWRAAEFRSARDRPNLVQALDELDWAALAPTEQEVAASQPAPAPRPAAEPVSAAPPRPPLSPLRQLLCQLWRAYGIWSEHSERSNDAPGIGRHLKNRMEKSEPEDLPSEHLVQGLLADLENCLHGPDDNFTQKDLEMLAAMPELLRVQYTYEYEAIYEGSGYEYLEKGVGEKQHGCAALRTQAAALLAVRRGTLVSPKNKSGVQNPVVESVPPSTTPAAPPPSAKQEGALPGAKSAAPQQAKPAAKMPGTPTPHARDVPVGASSSEAEKLYERWQRGDRAALEALCAVFDDAPILSINCFFTTSKEQLPGLEEVLLDLMPADRIAWFVEGRPHDVDKVANRRAMGVIIQTPPSGPEFALPLERYRGVVNAQICGPERFTSTGEARCRSCVKDRAAQAEKVEIQSITSREELIQNPLYLETVRECVRRAVAGKSGQEELRRRIGKDKLKHALNHPGLLVELAASEELADLFVTAMQQRLEKQ